MDNVLSFGEFSKIFSNSSKFNALGITSPSYMQYSPMKSLTFDTRFALNSLFKKIIRSEIDA